MRPWQGEKRRDPKKPGTAVKLACVGEIELGTGSEIYCIEIPRPLRKKKKKGQQGSCVISLAGREGGMQCR